MKTAGIVIGVLMVGGAVVALSNNASASNTNVVNGCTFSNATNFNPNATVDNGTCLFEKQEDSENYQQQIEEQIEQEREQQQQQQEQEELAEVDCSGFKSQDSKIHNVMHLTTGSVTNAYAAGHALEKLNVKIYTDKQKYLAGENIIIYTLKQRLYDPALGSGGWEAWGTATSKSGEGMSMSLKVQSNDEIYNLFNGSALNNATLVTGYMPFSGNMDDWSFRKITISTANLFDIKEPVKFKIYSKIDMDGHKDKSKTKESAFTVYPASCSKTQDAESYSHDGEVMSFQSFVHPW